MSLNEAPTKRKGGRPRVPDDQRRTAITITISAPLARAIDICATRSGESRSRIAERMLNGGVRAVAAEIKAMQDAARQLVAEKESGGAGGEPPLEPEPEAREAGK